MDKNAKGVAFFNHKPSGCFWYRTKHPMDALTQAGIDVKKIHINEDVDIDGTHSFQLYGAYPFSFESSLKVLKQDGKKIIYDTDDALDLIEVTNPFYYAVKKDLASVEEVLRYADEVTVSTPQMAEYMKTKTTAPVTVLPNCYNPLEWTYPKPKREGFRIGFAGASPHVGDLIEILPAIKNLQAKYPELKFLIMGFSAHGDYQRWFKEYRYVSTPEGIDELNKLDRMLSEIKFEWVPFVDFDNYPATLTNLSLDIGLCPLRNTPFNRHRSTVKTYEYALAGALALASNVKPYDTEPTSVLVNDGHWEETIETYINDYNLMRGVHSRHLKWIQDNRNINDKIDLLKSIYGV